MGFDLDGYMQAKLKARTSTVSAPELKGWFGDSEPAFLVRGLNGEEFYRVREAVTKRKALQDIASRLLSGDGQAMADAIEEFYGDIPDDQIKTIETLALGVVEPKLNIHQAGKLVKEFPIRMEIIAKAIWKATGEGATAGE